MRYAPLFTVALRRGGDRPGPNTSVSLRPSLHLESGARALARHRLLARTRPGALEVHAPLNERGTPFLRFSGLELAFDLIPTDPSLAQRYALDELGQLRNPRFYRGGGEPELRVQSSKTPLARDALAWVEVVNVSAQWAKEPQTWTLTLAPKRFTWVYYLLGERGEPPEVQDRDSERGLRFTAERLEAGSSDAVAAQLLRQRGATSLLRLRSERTLEAAPQAGLSLVSGAQTLLSELPAPPVGNLHALPVDPETTQPALYRVLEL